MQEKDAMQRLTDVEASIAGIQKQLDLPPTHYHNGFDSNKISWFDIDQRRLHVHWTIPGIQAATATNYGVFFIVPLISLVVGFQEVHQTAGSDAGTVSLMLEKLTGTTAPDSGSSVLSAALSLKATANTVQTGTITSTSANKTMAIGDRLCLKDAGTLTAVANVTVLLTLQLL